MGTSRFGKSLRWGSREIIFSYPSSKSILILQKRVFTITKLVISAKKRRQTQTHSQKMYNELSGGGDFVSGYVFKNVKLK